MGFRRGILLLVLFGCLYAGLSCTPQPQVYRIHGTVTTTEGIPIPAGMIYFDPEGARTSPGVQGYAYIKEGKFDTADEGRGASGGKYLARVQGFNGEANGELPLGEPLSGEEEFKLDLPLGEPQQAFQLPPLEN